MKAKGTGVDSMIEIELHQDKTALRSRKGDTGSVLWKASIDFAQMVLQQCYAKLPQGLLDPEILRKSHVLELGAGTGLLSIALSSLVEQFTVTDIEALTPLIQKNIHHNGAPSNVCVAELDWVELRSTLPSKRSKIFDATQQPIDLLLAVDCLYHPSLIPPFVETIDYLCTPGRTTVLIISELRQEDVMREFLEAWLSKPDWQILRAPNDELGKHYVIWIGWKECCTIIE
ncbi:putative methyltransferase-domain-containing protein [Crepidotus variabilis]|uniref:Methyltransferase-domain-containing protein n=1 Tax=Crepidotus variabilis TaxID=179855 RepID=A0A9P6JMH0_9AGAR|nr:putative methyltransferase-domain-containing protein [Crepidotus variabilis]